jgi:hypothetical protein
VSELLRDALGVGTGCVVKTCLVTGTRRETRRGLVTQALKEYEPQLLIVGDCPTGVDAEARAWSNASGRACRLIVGVAAWNGPLGKAAGPFRNETMVRVAASFVKNGKEVVCFAVPDEDSKGTFGTIALAEGAGIDVYILGPDLVEQQLKTLQKAYWEQP